MVELEKEISKKLSVFDANIISFQQKKIKKDKFLNALFLTSEIKKHIHLFDYIIIACSLKTLLKLNRKKLVKINEKNSCDSKYC